VLFVAEVKVVSHGLLALGGAVALVAGSLLLFSGPGSEGYRVDLSIVVPGLLTTLAVVGLLSWKTLQLKRSPVRTGLPAMVGESARVVEGFQAPNGAGRVQVYGEYWDAVGPEGLLPGEIVRISRVAGRTLHVDRRIA
jgi:membrane-bound serine protease (ClpP class)